MPDKLTTEEIANVAYTALRGAAFLTCIENLAEVTPAAVAAYQKLDEALKQAVSVPAEQQAAEDRKVVEAATAYTEAETACLLVIAEYTDYAMQFKPVTPASPVERLFPHV